VGSSGHRPVLNDEDSIFRLRHGFQYKSDIISAHPWHAVAVVFVWSWRRSKVTTIKSSPGLPYSTMSSPATSLPATIPEQEEVATVCCGCRPQRRRYGRKSASKSARIKEKSRPAESNDFADADVVIHNKDPLWETESNDSQYFFDAVQEPLKDGEYPVVFYNQLKHKPEVSFAHPESLLRPNDAAAVRQKELALSERRPSTRLLNILRRGSLEHKQALESPRIKIPISGYPGELTIPELAQCVSPSRDFQMAVYCFMPC
jgi:hypothetical protein